MHKCFIMMTEENIQGREIIHQFLKNDIQITGILVEKSSVLAEKSKNYLKNDFYCPPSMYDLLSDWDIPLYFTKNHNNGENIKLLKNLNIDLATLGGTRLLRSEIIECASIGILNAHPGILPKYRGLDVVGWSILNGDPIGATCHFIAPEPDSGAIVLQRIFKYEKGDNLLKIRVKNMILCVQVITEAVKSIENIESQPQDLSRGKRYFQMPLDKIRKVEEILRRKHNDI